MARTASFLLTGMGLLTMAFAQSDRPAEGAPSVASDTTLYRTVKHDAFKPGEKLT